MADPHHRLSLCVNGAVALGSYEGGVIAQIYADVRECRAMGADVRIDAIGGASAGSITGLLLAQALTMDEEPDSFTARVRKAWVERLNMMDLLGRTDNRANSLFDSATVDAVAAAVLEEDATITEQARQHGTPPVAIWMALTNLEGIPYEIKLKNASVIASLYADYEPVVIQQGVPYRAPAVETLQRNALPALTDKLTWKDLGLIATVSGAFPFGFQSRLLKRNLRNYPDTIALRNLGAAVPDEATFNYTDGGILNNNPVGRLIDAVSFLGGTLDERTYLVIEPDPSEAKATVDAMIQRQGSLEPIGEPPKDLAFALIQTYFNDALYRDLDSAVTINRRLEKLLPLIERLKQTDEALANEILKASGFNYKREIDIERIPFGLTQRTLAGAFASHFGGFFGLKFREHDFYVGCMEARAWFEEWARRHGFPTPTSMIQSAPVPAPNPGGFPSLPKDDQDRISKKLTERLVFLIGGYIKVGFFQSAVVLVVRSIVGRFVRGIFRKN